MTIKPLRRHRRFCIPVIVQQKKKVLNYVVSEFQRVYKAKDENLEYEKELTAQLAKLQKTRQKYMDMYTDDLITRDELNDKIGGMRKEIERLENELKMVSYHLTKGEQLEALLNGTFHEIEDITDVRQMTNAQLKRIIKKIEVDKDGNVDIYLHLFGDLGLDEHVLIEDNTVLNNDNQTGGLLSVIHEVCGEGADYLSGCSPWVISGESDENIPDFVNTVFLFIRSHFLWNTKSLAVSILENSSCSHCKSLLSVCT